MKPERIQLFKKLFTKRAPFGETLRRFSLHALELGARALAKALSKKNDPASKS